MRKLEIDSRVALVRLARIKGSLDREPWAHLAFVRVMQRDDAIVEPGFS